MGANDEKLVEAEIQDKGLTAPRITPDMLDAMILDTRFIRPEGTTLTICVITLHNGFVVTGESAAASPANFDAEIGQRIARDNARAKLWPLAGFRLRDAMANVGDLNLVSSTIHTAAAMAHEVNRLWCQMNGDFSQLPWSEAPEWQKDSVVDGIRFHLENPDTTPEKSHENWMAHKAAEGWVWGEVKDAEAKTHPCMLPYGELPEVQRVKDALFQGVVRAICGDL